jgi:hypothetical protein
VEKLVKKYKLRNTKYELSTLLYQNPVGLINGDLSVKIAFNCH